jgi:fatty-acyl-CoA synthase
MGRNPGRLRRTEARRHGTSAEELIAHCRGLLAGYKVPREIRFEEIPKTSTGKIQKFQLRERAKSTSAIE